MIFAGLPQFAGWQIEILATDVSADAIARAKDGVYTQAEVQRGLPLRMLGHHFRAERGGWRIADSIRSSVQFRVFNLLEPVFESEPFDAILCRNVLMYFESPTKAAILGRLSGALADDGYLVVGAAETVLGAGNSFISEGRFHAIKPKASRPQKSRRAALG
jgi:chemotaxis protein methyltransferase CheR